MRNGLAMAALCLFEHESAPALSMAKSSGPAKGSLLAIGGGDIWPEIQRAAIALASPGGRPARWVYIPTAGDDDEIANAGPPGFIALAATTLHTRDRNVADGEGFTAPLRAATAVFFGGGRQWRLVDAYAGTLTERELRGVLDRGGLISGTSAGATIQGSYLVRGAPSGNDVLMSPGHERGFGYLKNAAIDQHITARGRQKDLAIVVAAHPGLLGIGIDEGTAIVVRRNRMAVIGSGRVFITDGARHDGAAYYTLRPGARFDLATWTVLPTG
jgi:cyanophycinase